MQVDSDLNVPIYIDFSAACWFTVSLCRFKNGEQVTTRHQKAAGTIHGNAKRSVNEVDVQNETKRIAQLVLKRTLSGRVIKWHFTMGNTRGYMRLLTAVDSYRRKHTAGD